MSSKIIMYETVPRWYSLEWWPTNKAVVINVHHDFVPEIKNHLRSSRYTEEMKHTFEFSTFECEMVAQFGYDEALRAQEEDGFTRIIAVLPTVHQIRNEVCPDCRGSGQCNFVKRECLSCYGDKKKHEYVWKPAYALSASLSLLFGGMRYPQITTGDSRPQLLTVSCITDKGMYGGVISGEFSIPAVNWLSKRMGDLPEMVRAMKDAHEQLMGKDRYEHLSRFRASVDSENGWLNVDCPGDACGLNPSSHGIYPGEGYEFSPHNTDTPAQQLTLLAGLAALHKLIDSDLP